MTKKIIYVLLICLLLMLTACADNGVSIDSQSEAETTDTAKQSISDTSVVTEAGKESAESEADSQTEATIPGTDTQPSAPSTDTDDFEPENGLKNEASGSGMHVSYDSFIPYP